MSTRLLDAADPRTAADAVTARFAAVFGGVPDGVWSAPGRVNLIGEHVDYNAGLCLPLALPHRTVAALRRRDDGVVHAVSAQEADAFESRLDDVGPGVPEGWPAYVAGVLWALAQDGARVPGLDVAVDSSVPVGAGLSSSAAIECAVAVGVADLVGLPLDGPGRRRLAVACVRAENEVAGAPTGGMDQAAALLATAGHALLVDSRTGDTRQVPLALDDAGVALLVVDTRAPHRLVDGQYAERRRTCEEAARALGVTSLREVDDLDGALDRLDDGLLRRRVRHVVTEIERVRQTTALLDEGRVRALGPLLDASHTSLRDDYEVSSPELDTAVDAARSAGALGARMTGGGFGGSAVALVEVDGLDDVMAVVTDVFSRNELSPPRFLLGTPSDGASRTR